ncbi:hypothetical protein ScPMuIL_015684 [Solemya velum]
MPNSILQCRALLVAVFCGMACFLVTGQPDPSVCKMHDVSGQTVFNPLPAVPAIFSTRLEWKMLHNNQTTLVEEYHYRNNKVGPAGEYGINNITSIHIHSQGLKNQIVNSQMIFDNDAHQYLIITDDGCQAYPLSEYVNFNNSYWLTSSMMLYRLMLAGNPNKTGFGTVRSMPVEVWSSCVFLLDSNTTMKMEISFASSAWHMALSPSMMVSPLQIELYGKQHNMSDVMEFHVIGDYVDFNQVSVDLMDEKQAPFLNALQPPPGQYCQGRRKGKMINGIGPSFSSVIEIVDSTQRSITYDKIWFDSKKNLVKRVSKGVELQGDQVPITVVYDFNTGTKYMMNENTETCQAKIIREGDLFVKTGTSNNTLVMQSVGEYFHITARNIQYRGRSWSRGVLCDVWIGTTWESGNPVITEWYFTGNNMFEGVGLDMVDDVFFHMDKWKGNRATPAIYNINQFDSYHPQEWSHFNIGLCYKSSYKKHFIMHFVASNITGPIQAFENKVQEKLVEYVALSADIDTIRIVNVKIEYDLGTNVYFRGTMLDVAPIVSPAVPRTPEMGHQLVVAFSVLKQRVWSKEIPVLKISTLNIQLYAVGLVETSFSADFTTTTQPVSTATTIHQLIPSMEPSTTTPEPKSPPPPFTRTPTTTATTTSMTTSTTLPTTASTATVTSTTTATTTPKPTSTSVSPTTTTLIPSTKAHLLTRTTSVVGPGQPCTTPTPCHCQKVTCPVSPVSNCTQTSTVTSRHVTRTSTAPSRTEGQTHALPPGGTKFTVGLVAGIGVATFAVGILLGFVVTTVYHMRTRKYTLRNSSPLIANIEYDTLS